MLHFMLFSTHPCALKTERGGECSRITVPLQIGNVNPSCYGINRDTKLTKCGFGFFFATYTQIFNVVLAVGMSIIVILRYSINPYPFLKTLSTNVENSVPGRQDCTTSAFYSPRRNCTKCKLQKQSYRIVKQLMLVAKTNVVRMLVVKTKQNAGCKNKSCQNAKL